LKQIQSGWLAQAERVPSPNFNERPGDAAIDLLVVHNISLPPGEFGGPWIDALFQNRLDAKAHPFFAEIAALRVSSHLLIRRDGRLIQYVPLHKRAWHAGDSIFAGRRNCNDYSIGVELEGADDCCFEDIQYQRLAQVTKALRKRYPAISKERIAGHSDIAPGRKSDPGPHFDWPRFFAALARPS
jgi:AmpD protein